jgi:uncharacterized lipoprotein YmbA
MKSSLMIMLLILLSSCNGKDSSVRFVALDTMTNIAFTSRCTNYEYLATHVHFYNCDDNQEYFIKDNFRLARDDK